MSFDILSKKPKLVDLKLVKYYNEKLKMRDIQDKIKQDEIIKQQEIDELNNKPIETIMKRIGITILDFIKENYGFVILVFLLVILLYVRYIEVYKRKQKIKELINNAE
jgi:hypothetical protein